MKQVPAEWCRVIVKSAGYAPRVAGYARFGTDPHWQSFDTALATSASVTGRVTDESGQPLADVLVRTFSRGILPELNYSAPSESQSARTDSQGHFHIKDIPAGSVSLNVIKGGYSPIALPLRITAPQKDLDIRMGLSATLRVTVEFAGVERSKGYMIELEPEGGNKVGSFGGSANINLSNQYEFQNVPPGRYTIKGRPNPGSIKQTSDIVTVDLKGGQFQEVILKAK